MKKLLSFVLALVLGSCSAGKLEAEPSLPPSVKFDYVVAQDGSGDFKTVQQAFDAVPANSARETIVFVKKGVYKQVVTLKSTANNVRLIGEDVNETVITFDNYSGKDDGVGGVHSTSTSATAYINGDNFVAENISFENAAGPVGQALAIYINGGQAAFYNCRFIGNQDTYYAHQGTKQYLKNCYIEGTVDFIFGGSVAFFDNCRLHSLAAGYITAASTPENSRYGYVFSRCTATAKQGANYLVYLGRPWRPFANVVFLNTSLGAHIRPQGWLNWSGTENYKTCFYAEYQNNGTGAVIDQRVGWSVQLSASQAAEYTKEKVLGFWTPKFLTE